MPGEYAAALARAIAKRLVKQYVDSVAVTFHHDTGYYVYTCIVDGLEGVDLARMLAEGLPLNCTSACWWSKGMLELATMSGSMDCK